jgi:hypothetical protein
MCFRRVSKRRGEKHARLRSHESTHKGVPASTGKLLLHICLLSIALFGLKVKELQDEIEALKKELKELGKELKQIAGYWASLAKSAFFASSSVAFIL